MKETVRSLQHGAGVGMENSWLGPQGKSLEKSDLTLIHSPSSYVKICWKTLLVSSSPGVSHFPSRDIFVVRHPGTLIIGNIYMWLGQKPPVVVDLLEVGSVTSSLALASSPVFTQPVPRNFTLSPWWYLPIKRPGHSFRESVSRPSLGSIPKKCGVPALESHTAEFCSNTVLCHQALSTTT